MSENERAEPSSDREAGEDPAADGEPHEEAATDAQPGGESPAGQSNDDATAAEATATSDPETDDVEPDEGLVERVADAAPEDVAREVATLREEVQALSRELADERDRADGLESKLKRKQADFQNFKKRQEKKREQERQRATEDLVERLLDVRDNLVRALEQDDDADIRGGVETTLSGFDRVLDAENVEAIEPAAGTDLDPVRHEALMRVESDEEPGSVVDVHRPGYEMAGKVLRPAQVTVAADDE